MNAVAKASTTVHDSAEWHRPLSKEMPAKAYLLSMFLAIGVHAAVIFGWQGRDERALTSVQRWTFRPARRDGKPVPTQVDVPVRFSLDR